MASKLQQFNSHDLPQREVLESWIRFITEGFSASYPEPSGKFVAQSQRVSGPFLNLAHVKTTASTVFSPGRPSTNRPKETVVLHLNVGSKAVFEQFDTRAQVNLNDLFICQSDHPYSIANDDEFQILALTLAPEALRACGVDLAKAPVSLVRGQSGPGAALALLLRNLWDNPSRCLEVSAWAETQDTIVSILAMAMAWETRGSFGLSAIPHDMREFINDHLSDWSLDVNMIASAFGISARQVQRLFALAGTTPRQFILERRLDRAAVRLRSTSTPVTQIAYECGFSDLTYFGRTFRHRFGVPPREYRVACRCPTPQSSYTAISDSDNFKNTAPWI